MVAPVLLYELKSVFNVALIACEEKPALLFVSDLLHVLGSIWNSVPDDSAGAACTSVVSLFFLARIGLSSMRGERTGAIVVVLESVERLGLLFVRLVCCLMCDDRSACREL